MAKQTWKAGNMLYPIPAVMVSVTDGAGQDDIITVAWTGTICTNPPMVYISVRPSRFSHHMLMETGEFVINLTTEKLTRATDYCGVRSGRAVDKFKETGLTREKAEFVKAPMIRESPVSIECRVTEVKKLGSHDMFLAEVLGYMRMKNIWMRIIALISTVHVHWYIPTENILAQERNWALLVTVSKSGEKVRKNEGYQRGIAETGHL